MSPTVVLKLCGHVSRGPSGEFDQSWARISAPISPPAVRNPSSLTFALPSISCVPFRKRGYLHLIALGLQQPKAGPHNLAGVLGVVGPPMDERCRTGDQNSNL